MDFQDLVDTPRKVKTLAGTVAFLVLFPVYFTVMPSVIDEEIVGGGSSGLTGTLIVSFEESEISLVESVVLGDGETHDTFFELMTEPNVNVGYVEFAVSCFDNDDPGPGFTDSVEGTSDLSGLDVEDQTADGPCSGGDGGFTMRWDLTENYTGEMYTEEEQSESEIRERRWHGAREVGGNDNRRDQLTACDRTDHRLRRGIRYHMDGCDLHYRHRVCMTISAWLRSSPEC